MTDDELLYDILLNSDKAKSSNEEALREFYWQRYGIAIPDLKDGLSFQTIFRKIRRLKEVYPKLKGSEETQQAKKDKEDEFKEMALDVNTPIIQREDDDGQLKIGGVYW